MGNNKDLIDVFVNITKKETDAPVKFLKSAGYHLVSNLLGRFFIIPDAQNLRPNLFFVNSAIPSRFRRSTVHSYHNQVFKRALRSYYSNLLSRPAYSECEHDANDLASRSLIGEGSPEGITDHLQDMVDSQRTIECFTIMSDELGGVLRQFGKGYSSGISQLYSKIYYGRGGEPVYLSKRGKGRDRRFVPEDVYVTMFSNMQELDLYLDESHARQGFLRRLFLVYQKANKEDIRQRKRLWTDNALTDMGGFSEKLKKLGKIFGDRMLKYEKYAEENRKLKTTNGNAKDLIPVTPKIDKVLDLIGEYGDKYENQVLDMVEPETLYKTSHEEKLVKLSTVCAISKGNIQETKRSKFPFMLSVNVEDVERARDFLDEATESAEDRLSKIGERRSPVRTEKKTMRRILKIVRTKGRNGVITSSKILQYSGKKKEEFKDYAETLIESGKLRFALIDGVRGRGGTKKLFFDNEPGFNEVVEKLNAKPREEADEHYDGPVYTVVRSENAQIIQNLW